MTARVLINNLLVDEQPQRADIEAAVREAFERLQGGPWAVTLRKGIAPDSVSVEVRRASGAIAFTSVYYSESREMIWGRIRIFAEP